VSVIAFTNSRDDCGVSALAAWVVNALPLFWFRRGVCLLYKREKLFAQRGFC
jgi:hypothetical protein